MEKNREFFEQLNELEEVYYDNPGRKKSRSDEYSPARLSSTIFEMMPGTYRALQQGAKKGAGEWIRWISDIRNIESLYDYITKDMGYGASEEILKILVAHAKEPKMLKNYKKDIFRYEHGVPVSVILNTGCKLVGEGEWTHAAADRLAYLLIAGRTIITREEDSKLNNTLAGDGNKKLKDNMPAGWNWQTDSPYARYEAVGIKAVPRDEVLKIYEAAKNAPDEPGLENVTAEDDEYRESFEPEDAGYVAEELEISLDDCVRYLVRGGFDADIADAVAAEMIDFWPYAEFNQECKAFKTVAFNLVEGKLLRDAGFEDAFEIFQLGDAAASALENVEADLFEAIEQYFTNEKISKMLVDIAERPEVQAAL